MATKQVLVMGGVLAILAIAGVIWFGNLNARPSDSPIATNKPSADPEAWFQEAAAERGLDFTHTRGLKQDYYFPELVGGGAALCDFDADGFLDVYMVQSGDLNPENAGIVGNMLFRNQGNGFFADVTEKSGTGDTGYGMGCACGDYNGDGQVDLYVTNYGPNVLYRNNGDGTFTDVSREAGVQGETWSASAAFLDHDGDGDLDLFVVNYINWNIELESACFTGTGKRDYCKPNNYNAPAADTLFQNNGDGTFTDISSQAGIHAFFGNGLGVAIADFNQDRRPDIYVANDGMPNQYWVNMGGGRFQNDAVLAGCAVNVHGTAEAGMGVSALDIDHDSHTDMFMTHLREETNTFYLNRGGWFDDVTAGTGLSASSMPYTGFGMGFADFDHDGMYDLFIANGRVGLSDPIDFPDNPYAEEDLLFRGVGKLSFERVRKIVNKPEQPKSVSRAAAFGDLDNDGDVDIVVNNNGGRAYVLLNRIGRPENAVAFQLARQSGVPDGAVVTILANGQTQTRMLQRAYSYCASNDPRVHFGVGGVNSIESVTVTWPDGRKGEFGSVASGALYRLSEGETAAVEISRFRGSP
ncbi:MAG: CRTAC1 family protein [Planctomycetota bacterium]|jgi:hypothetical protein